MNEIKTIDLFGGIGGFRLGLEKANELVERTTNKNTRASEQSIKRRRGFREYATYRCVWYCDKDKYAVQTYNKNFQTDYEPTDITTVQAKDIPDFDMLCAGFPCQSFSIAGKRKGFQDIRGTMFFEICRLVKAKKPSYVFLENVKGLLSADNGRCFYTILLQLDELGYDVEWQVLNSKNFGVPQNRERVFIIGHLRGNGRRQVFPITGESSGVLEMDYEITGKTPSGLSQQGDRVYNSNGISPTLTSSFDESTPKITCHTLQPRCGNPKQGGTGHLSRDDGRTYCIDGWNCQVIELSNSVRSGGRGSLDRHQWDIIKSDNYIRRLTPIECERLQGFPDNWTKGVSDTQRYKQLGNSVTVNVIQAIGVNL